MELNVLEDVVAKRCGVSCGIVIEKFVALPCFISVFTRGE
jgi:hypothetical protein